VVQLVGQTVGRETVSVCEQILQLYSFFAAG
jgi:hypothetical protein